MKTLITYFNVFIKGSCMTLGAWLFAGTLSIIIGLILGIISAQAVGSTNCKRLVRIYTFITKGIPAYVQILIVYFIVPNLLGINVPSFFAASWALAICSSGYITEIVRAQINSLPQGQWDACYVLGYPLPTTIRRIILPQALKTALPALIGELEQLLKSTSLLATIGVTELTRVGMNIISRELNPIPVYLVIAGIYLLFSGILNGLASSISRKSNYDKR